MNVVYYLLSISISTGQQESSRSNTENIVPSFTPFRKSYLLTGNALLIVLTLPVIQSIQNLTDPFFLLNGTIGVYAEKYIVQYTHGQIVC